MSKIKKQAAVKKTIIKPLTREAGMTLKTQLYIFIAVFSFALYIQSVSFDYVYDDITVIHGNKLVKEGLGSIGDLFSSDYWYGFSGKKEGPIYRPLSLVMFAAEWQMFPDYPMPGHLINVILFSLTCVLLFRFLIKLFQNNLIIPFLCTVLFAAHPIHTEVINNIKSRDEILCFLFAVISLDQFMRFYTSNKSYQLLTGAFCFFLSLLSKETGISFLLIIPMTLFVFRDMNKRNFIYAISSVFLFAAIYLVLRQMISDHRPVTDGIGLADNFMLAAKDKMEAFASGVFVLLQYLRLLIFPHPLSSDYSYAQIPLKSITDPFVITGLLVYGAATIFSLYAIWKKNKYAYAILFFLISIFPVSNILFLIGSSMAERFLYIPSLGFCLVLAMGIVKLTNAAIRKNEDESLNVFFKNYKKAIVITLLIAVLYSIKTLARSRDWSNDVDLFKSAVKVSPNSTRAHYAYASALLNSVLENNGNTGENSEKLRISKIEYERSIEIFPQYWIPYNGFGLYYKNLNDFQNSAINFEKAVRLNPKPNANLYKELGYAYLKTGQFEKSIAALDTSIQKGNESASVYNFKGSALFSLQRFNEAIAAYSIGESIDPDDVDILRNVGKCYANLRQYDKAETYFKKCLQLQPGNPENKQMLISVYQLTGETQKANALQQQQ